jgi:hypothetical protein
MARRALRKSRTLSKRSVRKWMVVGAVPLALGGIFLATAAAQANPLFGSHHHRGVATAGGASGYLSMRSHTDTMQWWSGSGGSGSGSGGGYGGSGGYGGGTPSPTASTPDGSGGWGTGTGTGSGGGGGGGGGTGGGGAPSPSASTTPSLSTSPSATTPGGGSGTGGGTVAQDTSTNWAGYADTGSRFTSVSASWTQPTVQCGADQTFSSYWVGLDGDGTDSVEQTGSEADCSGGTATNFGWFEMFPAAPVEYNKPVAAGDAMSASVTTDGDGNFTLTLTDQTQGWNQVTNQSSQVAQLGSAEVVAEAPSGQNGVLPLTNFGTVNFTDAEANGAPIDTGSTTAALTMVSGNGTLEATPSALSAGENFSVTWNSE